MLLLQKYSWPLLRLRLLCCYGKNTHGRSPPELTRCRAKLLTAAPASPPAKLLLQKYSRPPSARACEVSCKTTHGRAPPPPPATLLLQKYSRPPSARAREVVCKTTHGRSLSASARWRGAAAHGCALLPRHCETSRKAPPCEVSSRNCSPPPPARRRCCTAHARSLVSGREQFSSLCLGKLECPRRTPRDSCFNST